METDKPSYLVHENIFAPVSHCNYFFETSLTAVKKFLNPCSPAYEWSEEEV